MLQRDRSASLLRPIEWARRCRSVHRRRDPEPAAGGFVLIDASRGALRACERDGVTPRASAPGQVTDDFPLTDEAPRRLPPPGAALRSWLAPLGQRNEDEASGHGFVSAESDRLHTIPLYPSHTTFVRECYRVCPSSSEPSQRVKRERVVFSHTALQLYGETVIP